VKLKKSCAETPVLLPPYLNNTDPLEVEDLPLQVALLTMELARLRTELTVMGLINPDTLPEFAGPEFGPEVAGDG